MPYLLLFDIDGTILKFKEGISKEIFSDILTDVFGIGIDPKSLPDFSGKTDLQILNEIVETYQLDPNLIYHDIDKLWDSILKKFENYAKNENYQLLPGIDKLLPNLYHNTNFRLGLLTGNFKKNAYLKLSIFDLEKYFPIGAFGCEDPDRNNLPQIAIKRANAYWSNLNFNNSNTFIIGDSPKDIECAKANNNHCIAVATGYFNYEQLLTLNPDLIFFSFENYSEVINQISNYCKKLDKQK